MQELSNIGVSQKVYFDNKNLLAKTPLGKNTIDMKSKSKKLEQYLVHDIDDYKSIQKFLKKSAPIIGFIVHRFNTLEECLNMTICQWINSRSDTMGLLVIHKMSYSSKVELLNRISSQFKNDTERHIKIQKELILNLKGTGRLRNAVIHAEWENTDFEGYTHVNIKINESGINQEYLQFDENSLTNILELINKTIALFENYWDEI